MTRGHSVPVLAVLASGAGTTFQAVVDEIADGALPWRINVLAVDRPGTGAAERAAAAGIPVHLIDRAQYRGPTRSQELSQALSQAIPEETDLVLLAGFLSIVTEPLLTRFRRRMINLHPALLPEFGGPGMYGRRVHEAVLAAGRKQTGCTVHYVDAGTDTGEILLHRRIPVLPEDTPDTLARRVQPVEHRAVIDALLTLAPMVR
jgi:phosphoribosylglycinamide formyltransferase-1